MKEACRWKGEAWMKVEMEKMKDKKMKTMYNQNLEMTDYMKKGTLYSARRTWEVRSHMLDVAGNYPSHNKYNNSSWKCQACDGDVREDQEHLKECDDYVDLRVDVDLENEPELIDFFHRVMERRRERKWD